jgi:NAD-dependent dihydropyrimidine dehydrogenase PreA subunit
MSALVNAKSVSSQDVLNKIKDANLLEYGLYAQPLFDRLMNAKEESVEEQKELGVVAALNNADTNHALLAVLKNQPEQVMEGISVAAYALETEKKSLYIPESEKELFDSLKETAEKYGVELVSGIVNVRAAKGSALVHIVTAKNLADLFDDCYEDGVYVSVNGAELKKYPTDTKISEIIDSDDVKTLYFGYEYHEPSAAEMTVGEAKITNGVLNVLTSKDCVVQNCEKELLESRKTSCGKCVFCREGLIQLEYMQKEITEGRGKAEFIDYTKEIGEAMCFSTPCSMGQVSAKAALSATSLFASEYEEHIKKKNCPAGACSSFVAIYIDPHICTGCGDCMDVCPADCIEGKAKYIHMIDEFDCTKCGKCIDACDEDAIIQTTGKLPKLPDRLTKVGKFKKR